MLADKGIIREKDVKRNFDDSEDSSDFGSDQYVGYIADLGVAERDKLVKFNEKQRKLLAGIGGGEIKLVRTDKIDYKKLRK